MSFDDLKAKNRLEDLIDESGYALDRKPGQRYWHSTKDDELVVDIEKQRYYWPTMNENGDVVAWLRARLNWDAGMAVRYLKNRPKMANPPRLPVPEVESLKKAEPKSPVKAEPIVFHLETVSGVPDDERVRDAMRLAWDYPGGFLPLLKYDLYELLEKTSWLPTQLLSVVGFFDYDICAFCEQAFGDDWQDAGRVFLSISLGNNYEIRPSSLASNASSGSGNSGLYCADCVGSIKKWLRAIDLLAAYQSREK
jgi:hypothetical protein